MSIRSWRLALLGIAAFGTTMLISTPTMAAKKVTSPEVDLPARYCGRWYGYGGREKLKKGSHKYRYTVVKVTITSPKKGVPAGTMAFYTTYNKSLKKLHYDSKIMTQLKVNKILNRRTRKVSYAVRPQISRQSWGNLTLTSTKVNGKKQTALRLSIGDGAGMDYAFRKLQRAHVWAGL